MPKNGKAIKAVLFDLGKVIVDFDFSPAFRRLAKASSLTPEQIREYFMRSGLEVLYDGGKMSSREFHGHVKKALGHSLDYRQFQRVWNEVFTLIRPMDRLIRRLSRSHRLVLISNTNAMHYRHLSRTCPTLKYFDRLVLSFKEKRRKPDARLYRIAAKACRAKPEEILYIDDRQDLTEAAAALGFCTFTFKKNTRSLIGRMRQLEMLT